MATKQKDQDSVKLEQEEANLGQKEAQRDKAAEAAVTNGGVLARIRLEGH